MVVVAASQTSVAPVQNQLQELLEEPSGVVVSAMAANHMQYLRAAAQVVQLNKEQLVVTKVLKVVNL